MTQERPPRTPPRWVIRVIWKLHRTLYSLSRGRIGLRPPADDQWGMLRLRTVGRRTGRDRVAILGYLDDGPNLITPAMNGWADAEPAWWLNLQARPQATVQLPDGSSREVTARAATAEERPRLWSLLVALGSAAYSDAAASRRSREAAIVILEPRAG